MNVKLLRKIQKHILEEPKRFIMGGWIQRRYSPTDFVVELEPTSGDERWRFPECGTAGCIGGWAVQLSPKAADNTAYGYVGGLARELLKLSEEQAERLFAVAEWPERQRKRFRQSKTPRMRARIAAQRIDRFIATKGAE